jgi:hypothetical protein
MRIRPRLRSQPGLLDQVRGVIRRLHYNYSIHAEQANVDWIGWFILFHGKRHPAQMGAPRGPSHYAPGSARRDPPRLPEVFTAP